MDKEEIAEELRRRAAEMRKPSFASIWVSKDPRMILADGVYECAVLHVENNTTCSYFVTRTLSERAAKAVADFLFAHLPEYGSAMSITTYNDHIAESPIDVAVLLEKVAADI